MKPQSMTAKRYLEERYDAGRRHFTDLTQEEREVAVGYIIRDSSAAEIVEAVGEGDAYNLGLLLGKCLRGQTRRTDREFVEAFRKDVAARYEDRIDELFEEIAENAYFDAKYNKPYEKDERYYERLEQLRLAA